SNEIALVANAAFEQIIHRELAANLARALRGAFEPHRRAPRQHAELAGAEAPDLGDHLLGEAVAEVLLSWIVAHVRERQHHQAKRAGRPQRLPKLVARHDSARTLEHQRQNFERLVLETNPDAALPQLARALVHFKAAEFFHGPLRTAVYQSDARPVPFGPYAAAR